VSVIRWIEPVIESVVFSAARQTPADNTRLQGSRSAAANVDSDNNRDLPVFSGKTRVMISKEASNGNNLRGATKCGCDHPFQTDVNNGDLLANTKMTGNDRLNSKMVADRAVCGNVSSGTVSASTLSTAPRALRQTWNRSPPAREPPWHHLPAYVMSEGGLYVEPRLPEQVKCEQRLRFHAVAMDSL